MFDCHRYAPIESMDWENSLAVLLQGFQFQTFVSWYSKWPSNIVREVIMHTMIWFPLRGWRPKRWSTRCGGDVRPAHRPLATHTCNAQSPRWPLGLSGGPQDLCYRGGRSAYVLTPEGWWNRYFLVSQVGWTRVMMETLGLQGLVLDSRLYRCSLLGVYIYCCFAIVPSLNLLLKIIYYTLSNG